MIKPFDETLKHALDKLKENEMAICSIMEENGVELTLTQEEAKDLLVALDKMDLKDEPYLDAVETVLTRSIREGSR